MKKTQSYRYEFRKKSNLHIHVLSLNEEAYQIPDIKFLYVIVKFDADIKNRIEEYIAMWNASQSWDDMPLWYFYVIDWTMNQLDEARQTERRKINLYWRGGNVQGITKIQIELKIWSRYVSNILSLSESCSTTRRTSR